MGRVSMYGDADGDADGDAAGDAGAALFFFGPDGRAASPLNLGIQIWRRMEFAAASGQIQPRRPPMTSTCRPSLIPFQNRNEIFILTTGGLTTGGAVQLNIGRPKFSR